jgi:hypothetical protein
MLFLYFALAGNFWWFSLVLSIFELLVLRLRTENIYRFYYAYHIFSWGAPLIPVIIVLCAQEYGSRDPLTNCFITGNEWWAWTLYYIPGWSFENSQFTLVLI